MATDAACRALWADSEGGTFAGILFALPKMR